MKTKYKIRKSKYSELIYGSSEVQEAEQTGLMVYVMIDYAYDEQPSLDELNDWIKDYIDEWNC